MSKALERPSEWHKENARRERQQLVDYYVVGYAPLPEDPRDEYNAYFSCTPQGYSEALSFIASHRPYCDARPFKTQERRGSLPW